MAQLPYSEGVPSVLPRESVPDDYQHINMPAGAGGGLIARGLQTAGEGVTRAAETGLDYAKFFGQTQVDDASTASMQRMDNAVSSFRKLEGANRLKAQEDTEKEIEAAFQEGRAGLKTQGQQYQYDQAVRNFRLRYISGMMSTLAAEASHKYAGDTYTNQMFFHLGQVAKNPYDNNVFNDNLVEVKHANKQLRLNQGASDDALTQSEANVVAEAWSARIKAIAADGNAPRALAMAKAQRDALSVVENRTGLTYFDSLVRELHIPAKQKHADTETERILGESVQELQSGQPARLPAQPPAQPIQQATEGLVSVIDPDTGRNIAPELNAEVEEKRKAREAAQAGVQPAVTREPAQPVVVSPPAVAATIRQSAMDKANQIADPEVRELTRAKIAREIQAYEISAGQQERQKREASDAAYGEYLARVGNHDFGANGSLADDALKDNRILPGARHTLAQFIVQKALETEEPIGMGPGWLDAKTAILSSPGTVGHIDDPATILRRSLPGGDLTTKGAKDLVNLLAIRNKPEADAREQEESKHSLELYAKNLLKFEVQFPTGGGIVSPTGQAYFNNVWVPRFNRLFAESKAKGEGWKFLSDPKTVENSMFDRPPRSKIEMETVSDTGGAIKVPAPLPGVTPQNWKELMDNRPIVAGNIVVPPGNWADTLNRLREHPEAADSFERRYPGFKAADILAKMGPPPAMAVRPGAPAAVPPTAPQAPAPTLPATPAPAAPTGAFYPSSGPLTEQDLAAIRRQEQEAEQAKREEAQRHAKALPSAEVRKQHEEEQRKAKLAALEAEERQLDERERRVKTTGTGGMLGGLHTIQARREAIKREREQLK